MALALLVLPSCPANEQEPIEPGVEVSPTPTAKQKLTRTERFERAMERCREERRRYVDNRFIPPVSRRGDDVVLPVVWPDGSTAELRYPQTLNIHRIGVQPAVSLALRPREVLRGIPDDHQDRYR